MFTVIDFETTGLDYKENQVIEVGAVKLDKYMNVVDELDYFVSLEEGMVLSDFIKDLTGITEQDLKLHAKLTEEEGLSKLATFIGDDIVVAQNAPFDLSYLSKVLKPKQFYCTRAMSLILDPAERANLDAMAKRYQIEFNHHRAIDDARATAIIFGILLARMGVEQIDSRNVIIETPDRPFLFMPDNAIVQIKGGK